MYTFVARSHHLRLLHDKMEHRWRKENNLLRKRVLLPSIGCVRTGVDMILKS